MTANCPSDTKGELTMKKTEQAKASKPAKNPTTNYAMSSHKVFCVRCYDKHEGICPASGRKAKSAKCSL